MNLLPLVTIAVRFLGLVLILLHLDSVGRLVQMLVYVVIYPANMPLPVNLFSTYELVPVVTELSLVAAGLYLFLSGRWFIARLTRGLAWPGGGTCHKCGYDVTGVEGSRCPECGTKLPLSPEQVKR